MSDADKLRGRLPGAQDGQVVRSISERLDKRFDGVRAVKYDAEMREEAFRPGWEVRG